MRHHKSKKVGISETQISRNRVINACLDNRLACNPIRIYRREQVYDQEPVQQTGEHLRG